MTTGIESIVGQSVLAGQVYLDGDVSKAGGAYQFTATPDTHVSLEYPFTPPNQIYEYTIDSVDPTTNSVHTVDYELSFTTAEDFTYLGISGDGTSFLLEDAFGTASLFTQSPISTDYTNTYFPTGTTLCGLLLPRNSGPHSRWGAGRPGLSYR